MTIRELYTRSVICTVITLRIGKTWARRSSINCGNPATALRKNTNFQPGCIALPECGHLVLSKKIDNPVITVNNHHLDIADMTDDREGLEENITHLQKFIAGLKELDKAIMLLYLEEKTYREIAEIVGISETNTATKISRIKETLKQNFSAAKNDHHGRSGIKRNLGCLRQKTGGGESIEPSVLGIEPAVF